MDFFLGMGGAKYIAPNPAFWAVGQEVLGRKKRSISPNDHFLALGGHSMSVLQALQIAMFCDSKILRSVRSPFVSEMVIDSDRWMDGWMDG